MLKSGAKVTIEETDENVLITILPNTANWQKALLGIWLGVWAFCGILAFVGGLKEAGQDQMIFILIYLGFWAYFLFYGARSLIWNRGGAEYIRLQQDTLDYKRSWSGYGKVKSYDLGTIKNLGVINYSDKKFAKSYNEVFWTIGGESVGFEYIGQKVGIGFKLNEDQAQDIVRRIQKAAKKAERLA